MEFQMILWMMHVSATSSFFARQNKISALTGKSQQKERGESVNEQEQDPPGAKRQSYAYELR
jgi:hypothetical protein